MASNYPDEDDAEYVSEFEQFQRATQKAQQEQNDFEEAQARFEQEQNLMAGIEEQVYSDLPSCACNFGGTCQQEPGLSHKSEGKEGGETSPANRGGSPRGRGRGRGRGDRGGRGWSGARGGGGRGGYSRERGLVPCKFFPRCFNPECTFYHPSGPEQNPPPPPPNQLGYRGGYGYAPPGGPQGYPPQGQPYYHPNQYPPHQGQPYYPPQQPRDPGLFVPQDFPPHNGSPKGGRGYNGPRGGPQGGRGQGQGFPQGGPNPWFRGPPQGQGPQ